jgi:hypothetical protein
MHECALGLFCARYTWCKQLRGERVEAEGVLYCSGYKGWLGEDEGGEEGAETKGLQYPTVRGRERKLKYNGPRNKDMKHLCKSSELRVCSR